MTDASLLRASAAEHAYRATYLDGVVRRAPTLTLADFGAELSTLGAQQTKIRRLGRELVIDVWMTAPTDQPRSDAQGSGSTIIDAFADLAQRLADWHRDNARRYTEAADDEQSTTLAVAS